MTQDEEIDSLRRLLDGKDEEIRRLHSERDAALDKAKLYRSGMYDFEDDGNEWEND